MVTEGLVSSLARPGGNTGISLLSPELDGKRQEILIRGRTPGATNSGPWQLPKPLPSYHLQALQHAARSRGVDLSVFEVGGPEEIVSAIDAAKTSGAEALNFLASPLFSVPGTRNNNVVLERVASVRLPAIFQWPDTAGSRRTCWLWPPLYGRVPAAGENGKSGSRRRRRVRAPPRAKASAR
jgi:hypothetical protein